MPEFRAIQSDASIKGRIAVVTGGAKGIGESISHVLSAAGAHIVVADRDEGAVEKFVASLRTAGAVATAVVCDVGDTTAVRDAFRKIEIEFGAIDLLVNNAGIGDFVSFPEISRERWDRMLNVHLTGAYNCCHAVMPGMLERRFGRIVNVSSVAGKRGDFIGNAHYTAAKAGMIGLTKSLAAWAAPYGVRVNAIAPGIVDTELTREMSDAHRATTVSRIPLGRFARPDEIASVVLFLLSDTSSYVIGETINVNGGSYLD
jgi:NAD(P)-dependent dehydrogenase (short-subunit alcohol dehydrogenase family)